MHISSDSTLKMRPKNCPINNAGINDYIDRRLGIDRREFSYTAYLPERRLGKDRRCACDRGLPIDENRSETNNPECCSGIMY
jgi:hypothetical protein